MDNSELTERNMNFDILKYIDEDFLLEGVTFTEGCAANILEDFRSSTPLTNGAQEEEDFDPNLVELEELLSTSRNTEENSSIIVPTLNNVALMETGDNSGEPLEVMKSDYKIIRAPLDLENDGALANLPSIKLRAGTIKGIAKKMNGCHGVALPSIAAAQIRKPIRRAPLKLIQEIVELPREEELNKGDENDQSKREHKRKQVFEFPREDGVMFFSDGETTPQKKAKIAEDDDEVDTGICPVMSGGENRRLVVKIEPLPMEKIFETPKKLPRKPIAKLSPKECPGCKKSFKRLSMHKCTSAKIKIRQFKKVKPSDIALELNCAICKIGFADFDHLRDHQRSVHAHLICKTCKFVAKSTRDLRHHSHSCGNKITDVFKSTKFSKAKTLARKEKKKN